MGGINREKSNIAISILEKLPLIRSKRGKKIEEERESKKEREIVRERKRKERYVIHAVRGTCVSEREREKERKRGR